MRKNQFREEIDPTESLLTLSECYEDDQSIQEKIEKYDKITLKLSEMKTNYTIQKQDQSK